MRTMVLSATVASLMFAGTSATLWGFWGIRHMEPEDALIAVAIFLVGTVVIIGAVLHAYVGLVRLNTSATSRGGP